MGCITEKNRVADVICQHKADGTIIPIKIRFQDDDGEFQSYQIRAYKELSKGKDFTLPNGVHVSGRIRAFECKILVFSQEKRINLLYNLYENRWTVSWIFR